MNKLVTTIVGATLVAATSLAFAGPNWNIIEKARRAKQVDLPALSSQTAGPRNTVRFAEQDPAAMAAMMKECANMTRSRD